MSFLYRYSIAGYGGIFYPKWRGVLSYARNTVTYLYLNVFQLVFDSISGYSGRGRAAKYVENR